MAVVKKKVGRPPKAKSFVEKLREDEKKALAAAIPSLEKRIATLELILENAVNAGRKLHEKFEALQKTHKKGWVPHDGDTQPVHNDSVVTVLLRSGETNGPYPAWRFLWKDCGEGTIVAYKVD